MSKQICDSDLFTVQCEYFSWPVTDLHQEWGVNDFPEKPALRIARFLIKPAPDDLPHWTNDRMRSDLYWILLQSLNEGDAPIPVLCDAVDKQFFGVATDQESARKLVNDSEEKRVIITVKVKLIIDAERNDKWAQIAVNRRSLDHWAPAEIRFI